MWLNVKCGVQLSLPVLFAVLLVIRWFGSCPDGSTHSMRKGKVFFIPYVSAPYLRKEFLTLRPYRILPMSQRSCHLWNLLQELGL